MKNSKTSSIRPFVFGFLAATMLSGVWILGFSNGTPPPPANAVETQTANTYFKNYYNGAQPVNARLKDFTIDMEQYLAMGQIAQQARGVSGFRIYFGKDANQQRIGLVVGVNAQGAEISNMILSTSAGALESCPVACDEASAITLP
jgi:hypothetical protein